LDEEGEYAGMLASMRPRRVSAVDLAASPELGLLRRSAAAASWMAPFSPLVPATTDGAAGDEGVTLSPAAVERHVTLDFAHRLPPRASTSLASSEGIGGAGECSSSHASSSNAPPSFSSLSSSSDGTAGGGGGGGGGKAVGGGGGDGGGVSSNPLGSALSLLSTMHVPLHTDGSVVCGVGVTDCVLDRVTPLAPGNIFFSRFSRFVFDVATNEYLIGCAQAGGDRVAFESIGCSGGDEMTWISACYARPLVPGGDTHLTMRTSTILRRLEPFPDFPCPADPLDSFRSVLLALGSFGGATVVDVGGVGGGGAAVDAELMLAPLSPAPPSAVVPVVFQSEPSSLCVVERLRLLALSAQPVAPTRLRMPAGGWLGVAPPVPGGGPCRWSAVGDAAGRPTAPPLLAWQGTAGARAALMPAAAAAAATGDALPVASMAAAGVLLVGGAAPRDAASPTTSPPAAAATAAGGGGVAKTPARRVRRPVNLETITDERVLARVLRNRLSASKSNERRKRRATARRQELLAALGAPAPAAATTATSTAPAAPRSSEGTPGGAPR